MDKALELIETAQADVAMSIALVMVGTWTVNGEIPEGMERLHREFVELQKGREALLVVGNEC